MGHTFYVNKKSCIVLGAMCMTTLCVISLHLTDTTFFQRFSRHSDFPSYSTHLETTSEFDLLQLGPFSFMPEFRNPCWREEGSMDFNCLPYFFLAGFPKCGSTDLYRRILLHPNVAEPAFKETHWLTRKRFLHDTTRDFKFYTHFFAEPVLRQDHLPGRHASSLIVGDGSVSTAWQNTYWRTLPGNEHCTEPCVINADYVRHLNPKAKIIMILRNPTERAIRMATNSEVKIECPCPKQFFSNFKLVQRKIKMATRMREIHITAVQAIRNFTVCRQNHNARHCAYDAQFLRSGRLALGLYAIFINDWLKRFPPDQMLFLRMEDVSNDVIAALSKVFRFLELDEPDTRLKKLLRTLPVQNAQPGRRVKMWNRTRALLDKFYQPYNLQLARLLQDHKYTWKT